MLRGWEHFPATALSVDRRKALKGQSRSKSSRPQLSTEKNEWAGTPACAAPGAAGTPKPTLRLGRGMASGDREDSGTGPGWLRAAEGKLWAGRRETGPPAPCTRIPRQYPAPRAPRTVSCLCPGPSASALAAGVGKWGRRCGGGGAPACLASDPRDLLAWAGLGGDSAAEGGRPAHLAPPPRLPKLCLYLPILDQPTRHPLVLSPPLFSCLSSLLSLPPLKGAELLPSLQDRQCCGFVSASSLHLPPNPAPSSSRE